jgi:hypothetical protein
VLMVKAKRLELYSRENAVGQRRIAF